MPTFCHEPARAVLCAPTRYRRSSVKLVAVALAALALVASARAQPNVVVIVTDDQRAGTLSLKRTPIIWRQLREPGVLFTHAYVPTSLCCPSRASILTGLFAHSHGVYTNVGGWATFQQNGMEERALPLVLDAAGYRTGLVGKYLNQHEAGDTPPGWDVFTEVGGGYWVGEEYATDFLRDRALEFIRSTRPEEPLFLYFGPYAPHAGSRPAPRHEGTWMDALDRRPPALTEAMDDKPPWLQGLRATPLKRYNHVLARRAETMMAVDEAVGAIVGELDAAGRLADTLIVLTSDNGVLLGEHRVYGRKNLPYREATQVPMLARFDGRLPPGRTDARLVLNVDIATTVASAAGVTMQTEGIDLLGQQARRGFPLEATTSSWARAGVTVPAFCGYRTSRYVYVRYDGGYEELYDHRRDPDELENAAARRPRLAARLRALARGACAPAPPGFAWR